MATRKQQVVDLLKSIETGAAEPVTVIDPGKYIQHNLGVEDGLAGFGRLLAQLPENSARVNTRRVFEDGDFVFAHTEYDFFGPKIGFDIFRFENDKIVEHWDNLQTTKGPNPSGRSMIDGPTEPVHIEKTAANKILVRQFVDDILVNGKLDRIHQYFDGDNYIQHNPDIPDQLSGLGAALEGMAAVGQLLKYDRVHMLLGEGNFVLVASEGRFAGKSTAYFDLFRVHNGKIAEHWDTLEAIPPQEAWKNGNGKFAPPTPIEVRRPVGPAAAAAMGTRELRRNFVCDDLFRPGEVRLVHSPYDRMILGGADPRGGRLVLDYVKETGTETILARREMGIVNLGDTGTVSCPKATFTMRQGDVVYLGMGAGPVTFAGAGRYYLVSTPAHREFPCRLISTNQTKVFRTGAPTSRRIVRQYIHPDIMETCQLAIGTINLEPGSLWATMPAHSHNRRSEVYLYNGMAPDSRVFHIMGEPGETRHMIVSDGEIVISPPWSIHSAVGTGTFGIIWATGGENIDFTDMEIHQNSELG